MKLSRRDKGGDRTAISQRKNAAMLRRRAFLEANGNFAVIAWRRENPLGRAHLLGKGRGKGRERERESRKSRVTKRKKRSSIPSHIFVSRSNAVKKEKKKTKDRRRCNGEGGGGEKRVETVSTGASELGSAEEKCRGGEKEREKEKSWKKVRFRQSSRLRNRVEETRGTFDISGR